VRLIGREGNPDGIGAVIRLVGRGRMGPAREVHAGSGYWSQDSCAHVMHLSEQPDEIQVRWPDDPKGKEATCRVPKGAREVHLGVGGELKVVLP